MIEKNAGGKTRRAQWWHREKDKFRCDLCPHACLVADGGRGRCLVRKGTAGELVSENDGKVASIALDPVEKKPLYNWRPGTQILSLGTVGCNLDCPFCQNWQLARFSKEIVLKDIDPDEVVFLARREGVASVAFTYNEPIVWYDFVYRTSARLNEKGLAAVLVTNGYITKEPWADLLPLLSAANIDLKGFSEATYARLGGKLEPVLERIAEALEAGVHVELTHLVVPGINDNEEEFRAMVDWIAEISTSIPLHISRYFPRRKWTNPLTSLELLERYEEIAREKLNYVYLGNVEKEAITLCPRCKAPVLKRRGYLTENLGVDEEGRCSFCHTPLGIVMK